jgi:Dolichyl-phosphate-mannose-protein mannosyltransferase
MNTTTERPRWASTILRFLPPALLLVHAGLLMYGAAVHSPSIDEVGHMAAGLSHWKFERFDLYHVNPPLVRMVAVVPVLFAEPKYDWSAYSDAPGARSEFQVGRDFITANGERSFWFFTWARWVCIPFSLLGGTICYRWARELYGDWSGLLALTLWCFGPNILANGQMITPDMGATAFGLTAAYFFWKWLKEPSWEFAFSAGLALGLAELSKTIWILLFAFWPLLWLIWLARRASEGCGSNPRSRVGLTSASTLNQAGHLALILSLAVCLINAAYGFDGSMTQLRDYRFVSDTLGGPRELRWMQPGNRFANSWVGVLPVPVPRDYLLGIDVQKHEFEIHWNSYLRGEWRQEGWWYYYLYALAIKVPLGVWLLALLAVFLGLTGRGYLAKWGAMQRRLEDCRKHGPN